jgi:hypothetical protein
MRFFVSCATSARHRGRARTAGCFLDRASRRGADHPWEVRCGGRGILRSATRGPRTLQHTFTHSRVRIAARRCACVFHVGAGLVHEVGGPELHACGLGWVLACDPWGAAASGLPGGGKTTLLNMLGTVDRPSRGEVIIGGVRIGSKTPDSELAEIRLNNLGFVFQVRLTCWFPCGGGRSCSSTIASCALAFSWARGAGARVCVRVCVSHAWRLCPRLPVRFRSADLQPAAHHDRHRERGDADGSFGHANQEGTPGASGGPASPRGHGCAGTGHRTATHPRPLSQVSMCILFVAAGGGACAAPTVGVCVRRVVSAHPMAVLRPVQDTAWTTSPASCLAASSSV